MARSRTVVIDEIHLSLRIPNDLPDDKAETTREALAGDEFMSRLRRAVRSVLREFPELNVVRVLLSR